MSRRNTHYNRYVLLMNLLNGTHNTHWQKLEDAIGYSFGDRALFAEALTHRSYANERPEVLPDNERLEFLGDAVLDLVISQYLMANLPEAPEGELTRIRAEVVALPSLERLARSLELGNCLLLGRGEERSGGRDKASLLADALEALFGAIFTDGGFDCARSVILPLFVPLLQQAEAKEGQDYKSRLQEILQAAQRELPVYQLAETTGPAHERTYLVEVIIDGRLHGSGEGRTKKGAEQTAAKAALASLDKHS
jgi:ribonuclease-3